MTVTSYVDMKRFNVHVVERSGTGLLGEYMMRHSGNQIDAGACRWPCSRSEICALVGVCYLGRNKQLPICTVVFGVLIVSTR